MHSKVLFFSDRFQISSCLHQRGKGLEARVIRTSRGRAGCPQGRALLQEELDSQDFQLIFPFQSVVFAKKNLIIVAKIDCQILAWLGFV